MLSRPQGHSAAGRIMSMKNSNEPATFWLAAQCLNQLHHQQRAPIYQYVRRYQFRTLELSSAGLPGHIVHLGRLALLIQLRLGVLMQLRLGVLIQIRLGVLIQIRLGVLIQLRLGVLIQIRLGVLIQFRLGVLIQIRLGVLIQPRLGVLIQIRLGVLIQLWLGVLMQIRLGGLIQLLLKIDHRASSQLLPLNISFDFTGNRSDVTAVYPLTWHPVGGLLTDRSAFRQLPSQYELICCYWISWWALRRTGFLLACSKARSDGLLTASCNTLRRADFTCVRRPLNTVVPPYPLIQCPRITAARKGIEKLNK
jgi:hypothetical protein